MLFCNFLYKMVLSMLMALASNIRLAELPGPAAYRPEVRRVKLSGLPTGRSCYTESSCRTRSGSPFNGDLNISAELQKESH